MGFLKLLVQSTIMLLLHCGAAGMRNAMLAYRKRLRLVQVYNRNVRLQARRKLLRIVLEITVTINDIRLLLKKSRANCCICLK